MKVVIPCNQDRALTLTTIQKLTCSITGVEITEASHCKPVVHSCLLNSNVRTCRPAGSGTDLADVDWARQLHVQHVQVRTACSCSCKPNSKSSSVNVAIACCISPIESARDHSAFDGWVPASAEIQAELALMKPAPLKSRSRFDHDHEAAAAQRSCYRLSARGKERSTESTRTSRCRARSSSTRLRLVDRYADHPDGNANSLGDAIFDDGEDLEEASDAARMLSCS